MVNRPPVSGCPGQQAFYDQGSPGGWAHSYADAGVKSVEFLDKCQKLCYFIEA